MLVAGVDVELLANAPAETILRKHAEHGVLEDALRTSLEHLLERHDATAARITGVATVLLLLGTLRGHHYLFGVDHDDKITTVHVRREQRLMLAAKNARDRRSEASYGLSVGVDDPPLLLDVH